MKANLWSHPKTGEGRIYFNFLAGQEQDKVFAVRTGETSFDLKVEGKTRICKRDDLIDRLEEEAIAKIGYSPLTWQDLLRLV